MTLPAAAWRDRVEFERRLVHASGTLYPVPYLLGWISWTETAALLVASVLLVATLEFLRLVVGLDHAVYRALTREYEADAVGGYALYQVSTAAVALLATTSVATPTLAVPTMWMLSVGDPISGALGGNGPREAKRPLVWVVMFAVCLAVTLPFTVPAFGRVGGVAVAVAGAVPATVADGIPPIVYGVALDDNLTIPPAALAGMAAAAAVLG
ncbi:Dolichol kinase [Halorubrum aquaticum]|uniref:Dolichol kinase n=1 Tax=Halorubrum aquaticum TaxID=387340 RepID=A0A1I3CQ10_9EURY|nr:dolichol kinase [Halorubrum aquaticum]SFH76473.1 Dolichol kinase [Halorubrum aquaticum]